MVRTSIQIETEKALDKSFLEFEELIKEKGSRAISRAALKRSEWEKLVYTRVKEIGSDINQHDDRIQLLEEAEKSFNNKLEEHVTDSNTTHGRFDEQIEALTDQLTRIKTNNEELSVAFKDLWKQNENETPRDDANSDEELKNFSTLMQSFRAQLKNEIYSELEEKLQCEISKISDNTQELTEKCESLQDDINAIMHKSNLIRNEQNEECADLIQRINETAQRQEEADTRLTKSIEELKKSINTGT